MDQRTLPLVQSLIVNEFAMDYPDFIMKEMRKIVEKLPKSSKEMKRIYNSIISEVNKYVESLTILPAVKEFEPPMRHVISFQKERDRAMSKVQENNSRGGIMHVFESIGLKAGKGSFFYDDINKCFSEPSMLYTFSSSYFLPRRYVMDSIGHEISIYLHKMATKDQE